ncbi:MAG TPA: amylo-alpha-1,6-glucosidase [Tepidisphaeraceae bacterium]|nr:amylo-alpha-1,6-glucosidase [Tepidisphaeraceae bacterium]
MANGIHVSHLDFPALIAREWLAANGIGGYASSTVAALNTRKYHGLLVAAMAPPARRMVLLARVEETLATDGNRFSLANSEYPGAIFPQGYHFLRAFNSVPFPRWAYQTDGGTVEKSLRLLHGENTVVLTYTLLGGGKPLGFELRPLLALRGIHQLMQQWNGRLAAESRSAQHYRVPATARTPEVFFAHTGSFEAGSNWYLNNVYRREFERGYTGMEDLWSPGIVRFTLAPGQPVHFICSSDPIDLDRTLERADWQGTQNNFVIAPSPSDGATRHIAAPSADPAFDALLCAAGQFIVAAPPDGTSDKPGEKSVTCIGNYPWGPPSARAALIGFGGLFLVPGRFGDARALLLSLAAREEHGLMPTAFPEDGSAALYDGADISLWYVNAVWNYFRYTQDIATLRRRLLDVVHRIIDQYRNGTDLGIATDSEGLLLIRATGLPTTWMDAKAGDWLLTPRQGKPVELNALWYNAVCIAAELSERYGSPDRAADLAAYSRHIKEGFNRRFWNETAGCCFDVVEDHGADASIRPNQLLAISLPFPALSLERHARVVAMVRERLLTPRGVRTLVAGDAYYMGRYEGNVVSRDRANYNGSAHPWLLGPYVTALLRVRGRASAARDEAKAALAGCLDYITGDGLGNLCELFDGDSPHRPGGAVNSSCAVGELLRAYAEEVLDLCPTMPFAVNLQLLEPTVSPATPPVNNPA